MQAYIASSKSLPLRRAMTLGILLSTMVSCPVYQGRHATGVGTVAITLAMAVIPAVTNTLKVMLAFRFKLPVHEGN